MSAHTYVRTYVSLTEARRFNCQDPRSKVQGQSQDPRFKPKIVHGRMGDRSGTHRCFGDSTTLVASFLLPHVLRNRFYVSASALTFFFGARTSASHVSCSGTCFIYICLFFLRRLRLFVILHKEMATYTWAARLLLVTFKASNASSATSFFFSAIARASKATYVPFHLCGAPFG